MLPRAREEGGFMLVEVVVATVVVAIALMAVMAGYDSAFLSLNRASEKSAAAALANQQLELYRSLPFDQVALDSTATADIGDSSSASYDSLYATSPFLAGTWEYDNTTGQMIQLPSGTVNEVTIDCGTPLPQQCKPVQTLTGSDGRSYRVETFIRDRANSTSIRWTERVVLVIIRNPSTDAEILREVTAFDRGPT